MAITINGSGTISGISAGGLPDGCITDADISGIAASKLSGSLPAIDASNLTGIDSIAWYARQATTHNIPHATYTKVANLSADLVTQNTGSSYSTTDSKFTVASGQEGVYYVFGAAGIDDIQREDIINVRIYKNGAHTMTYVSERNHYSASDSTPNSVLGAGPYGVTLDLAVGDYVELYVYHNEGSTEPTEEWLTYFGGFKL